MLDWLARLWRWLVGEDAPAPDTGPEIGETLPPVNGWEKDIRVDEDEE